MKLYQLLLNLVLFTTAVLAAPGTGAHFQSTPKVSCSGVDLVVSFDEAGLGNEKITYTLDAVIDATWGCVNNGGHLPKAANKKTFTSNGESTTTLSPHNGSVKSSLSLSPPSSPPSDFTCPAGLTLKLLSSSYDSIHFCDSTNGICFDLGSRSC